MAGVLHNTGQSLVFRPDTGPKHSLAVNVSAGPLAYRYQIEEVFLHYGTENSHGSEHRIAGTAFPAEVGRPSLSSSHSSSCFFFQFTSLSAVPSDGSNGPVDDPTRRRHSKPVAN